AIVYTGPRRLVFVDVGQGRFRPQEIRVGSQADGMYEVLEGLHGGDVVATSGVFLIAAEARISTAAKYWDDSATAARAMPDAPTDPGALGNPGPTPAPSSPTNAPPPTTALPPKPPVRPPGLSKPPATTAPVPTAVYTCPMHPEI